MALCRTATAKYRLTCQIELSVKTTRHACQRTTCLLAEPNAGLQYNTAFIVIQESRAVAGKLRDAAVNFIDTKGAGSKVT